MPIVSQKKLHCVLNAEGFSGLAGLAHLVEAREDGFDFWYGVVDVCASTKVVWGTIGQPLGLCFEDGRVGLAAAIQMRCKESVSFSPGERSGVEEHSLLSFAGVAALTRSEEHADRGETAGA